MSDPRKELVERSSIEIHTGTNNMPAEMTIKWNDADRSTEFKQTLETLCERSMKHHELIAKIQSLEQSIVGYKGSQTELKNKLVDAEITLKNDQVLYEKGLKNLADDNVKLEEERENLVRVVIKLGGMP